MNKLKVILIILIFVFVISGLSAISEGAWSRYAFIELKGTNLIIAVVSMHDNISATRTGRIGVSVTSFVNLFWFNENRFGERWILEGWWQHDDTQKVILFDTHEIFKEANLRKQKAQEILTKMPPDERRRMFDSTDPKEREYIRELEVLAWVAGGGSRRSVNRARDISPDRNITIELTIPIDFDLISLKKSNPIRFFQLRIEPLATYEPDQHRWGSTNTLETLYSNIIDLESGQ